MTAAGETSAGPGFGLPGGDGAVLFAGDFDFAVGAGAVAGDEQLRGAIEEDFDRAASCLLRKAGADFGPGSGTELAAEAAADVVHLDLDIGGRDLQVGSQRAGPTGDELGGWVGHDLVALPLNDGAVGFQAAVGDDGDAVGAIGDSVGLMDGLIGITGDSFASGLAI